MRDMEIAEDFRLGEDSRNRKYFDSYGRQEHK